MVTILLDFHTFILLFIIVIIITWHYLTLFLDFISTQIGSEQAKMHLLDVIGVTPSVNFVILESDNNQLPTTSSASQTIKNSNGVAHL